MRRQHGIDVAAKLEDDVVKQSNLNVIVGLRGVVFDCEVIRLRELGDAAGQVAVILRQRSCFRLLVMHPFLIRFLRSYGTNLGVGCETVRLRQK